MYLDEGAHMWLEELEALHDKHHELEQALRKAQMGLRRATAAPAKTRQEARVLELSAQFTALEAEIAQDTDKYFRKVLGITKDALVSLREVDGTTSPCLVATNFIARMLSDKSAVFTVHGASMASTLHTGVPAHNILMAREALGQRLVSVA